MDIDVNEASFMDDMSSIVMGVTADEPQKKRCHSSVSSSIKKGEITIPPANNVTLPIMPVIWPITN